MKIRKGDIEIEIADGNSSDALAIISALQGKKTGTRVELVTRPTKATRVVKVASAGDSRRPFAYGADVPVLATDYPRGFILLRELCASRGGVLQAARRLKSLGVIAKAQGMGTVMKELRALAKEADIDVKTCIKLPASGGADRRFFLLQGGRQLFAILTQE